MNTASTSTLNPRQDQQSFILALPPELLNRILEYLLPDTKGYRRSGPGTLLRGLCPDLIAVRTTCHKLRVVADQLTFWINEDTDLIDLFPHPRSRRSPDVTWTTFDVGMVLRFLREDMGIVLKVFLADKHFQRFVGRRVSWRFHHPSTMLAILETIPGYFAANAVSITLRVWDGFNVFRHSTTLPSNVVVSMLAVCRNLTFLELIDIDDELCLNLLAVSCPSLRVLWIRNVLDHKGGVVQGDLDCVCNLEVLDIRGILAELHEGFLPGNSAATLKSITILFYQAATFSISQSSIRKLVESFSGLTRLYLSPLVEEMCETLVHASFQLEVFGGAIGLESFDMMPDFMPLRRMLGSRSFSTLKRLYLIAEVHGGPEWISNYSPVIECVGKLENLEKLALAMGFCISLTAHFAKLSKLRQLTWFVPQKYILVADEVPVQTLFDDDALAANLHLTSCVRSALETRPQVNVQILEDTVYAVHFERESTSFFWDEDIG